MRATADSKSRARRAAAALQVVEEFVLSTSILGVAVLTIANVVARNLFGTSLAVAEEASQFLMIVVTFVGLGYAASRGRHIRMTAITDQLPTATRWRWERIVNALTALLMIALCVFAGRYVYAVFELGGVYPVTRLPYHAVFVVAPIGFGLAAIQYGLLAVNAGPPDEHAGAIARGAARD